MSFVSGNSDIDPGMIIFSIESSISASFYKIFLFEIMMTFLIYVDHIYLYIRLYLCKSSNYYYVWTVKFKRFKNFLKKLITNHNNWG